LRSELETIFGEGGLKALWERLDAEAPGQRDQLADAHNPRRVIRAIERALSGDAPREWDREAIRGRVVGLETARDDWDDRFLARIETMFLEGLEEEVRDLQAGDASWSSTAQQAIGYPEVSGWLAGELTREACVERIRSRTRKLAKKQMTWFRNQLGARWVPAPRSVADVDSVAEQVLQCWSEIGKVPIYDEA